MSLRSPQSALIIGSSGGIGKAMSALLRGHGVKVTELSRSRYGLDVTDAASVEQAAKNLSDTFDLIFVATGGLVIGNDQPEKRIAALDADAMQRQFALNAVGPALCLKHFSPFLPKDRASVFVVLTAKIGSIEDNRLGGWISYRAAKAAANQIVKTASIELARTRPQAAVIALHPGTVDTAMTKDYAKSHPAQTPKEAAEKMFDVLTSLDPKDTGHFFSYDGSVLPW